MEALATGITISVEEIAKAMKTSPNIVLEIARKRLPNKKVEKRQKIYWTKSEIVAVLSETPKLKEILDSIKKTCGENLVRWWNELSFNAPTTDNNRG